MEPAGSLGLDVLQTVGTDAAVLSCGRGAGLRRVCRGTITEVRVLFAAEAFVRDSSTVGAIASLTLGKGPEHDGGGIRTTPREIWKK